MHNIVQLLVLGSLLLGFETFFMCNSFHIFLCFYIFSTASIRNIQTWGMGFESQQDSLIFFLVFLAFSFLKQSFKKGCNIKNTLSTEELKY